MNNTTNLRLGLSGILSVARPSFNSHGSKSAKTMTPFGNIFPLSCIESD